jgi:hypothetical protein
MVVTLKRHGVGVLVVECDHAGVLLDDAQILGCVEMEEVALEIVFR